MAFETRAKSALLYLMVTCGALVEAGLIAAWVFPIMPIHRMGWPIGLHVDEQFSFGSKLWLLIAGAAVAGLVALALSWSALRRATARGMALAALLAWAAAAIFLWGSLSLTVALPAFFAFLAVVLPRGSAVAPHLASRPISAPTKGAVAATDTGQDSGASLAGPTVRSSPRSRFGDSLDGIDIVLEDLSRPVRPTSPLPMCPRCGAAAAKDDDFCARCGWNIRQRANPGQVFNE